MYIEDEELRELYKVASTDHIEKIETGLLHLEKHPDDRAKLDELLRATHSLKGDSRMLGVEEAEMLVHQMEDVLNEVKEAQGLFSETLCDRLYQGIDAVRKIAREAVTGEAHGVSIFEVVAQMMGEEDETESESFFVADSTVTSQENIEETSGSNVAAPASNNSQPLPENTSTSEHQIETVRVDFKKLDTLMEQAGELLATKMRLANRNQDVNYIAKLWEDWSRNFSVNQIMFQNLEQRLTLEEIQPLEKFKETNRGYLEKLGDFVNDLQAVVVEDNARLESVANDLESGIRNLRVVPLSQIFNLFPRMVRDLGKQLGKKIDFQIQGGDIAVDKKILEAIKDPLNHIIRNAIDHGLETPEARTQAGKTPTASLTLKGYQNGNTVVIESIDDGKGLDVAKIRATALRRCGYTEAELDNMNVEQK